MIEFFKGDIVDVEADVIVNAANGIGFMGGYFGKKRKFDGIAESIHYHTQGKVEKEAKKAIWRQKNFPGNVYVTSAANLKADYVFHAVTMFFPGTMSSVKTVEKCLQNILKKANEYKVKTLAIPLLGTGTGMIKKEKLVRLYKKYLENSDYRFIVVDRDGSFEELYKKK